MPLYLRNDNSSHNYHYHDDIDLSQYGDLYAGYSFVRYNVDRTFRSYTSPEIARDAGVRQCNDDDIIRMIWSLAVGIDYKRKAYPAHIDSRVNNTCNVCWVQVPVQKELEAELIVKWLEHEQRSTTKTKQPSLTNYAIYCTGLIDKYYLEKHTAEVKQWEDACARAEKKRQAVRDRYSEY